MILPKKIQFLNLKKTKIIKLKSMYFYFLISIEKKVKKVYNI